MANKKFIICILLFFCIIIIVLAIFYSNILNRAIDSNYTIIPEIDGFVSPIHSEQISEIIKSDFKKYNKISLKRMSIVDVSNHSYTFENWSDVNDMIDSPKMHNPFEGLLEPILNYRFGFFGQQDGSIRDIFAKTEYKFEDIRFSFNNFYGENYALLGEDLYRISEESKDVILENGLKVTVINTVREYKEQVGYEVIIYFSDGVYVSVIRNYSDNQEDIEKISNYVLGILGRDDYLKVES